MTNCPICGSEVEALDKTGDADGFDCPQHGKFKVASSVFVDGASGQRANREQWEMALKRAKARKASEWPVIMTTDF